MVAGQAAGGLGQQRLGPGQVDEAEGVGPGRLGVAVRLPERGHRHPPDPLPDALHRLVVALDDPGGRLTAFTRPGLHHVADAVRYLGRVP